MALNASPWADEPVERKPGEFARSKTGTPYVAQADGALVKSGARKGLAKMVPYGRPSGFGKQIESTYSLQKWSERTVALGLGTDYTLACAALATPELVAQAAALAGRDRDTEQWKSDADAVVLEAKRLAQADLAAERGTHGHALTEDDDTEQDWILRAERGEVLGLDLEVQAALVGEWRLMLDRDGVEVLATEFKMVHDGYRMAGTGDRIGILTRDLTFVMITGELVTLTAGTVVVLDIKTGRHRTNPQGASLYWASYSVQIAAYAGGVLYDPDTDVRTPYPWPVDQHWALIAHLDMLGAIAGNPSCTLVLVDIEAGRAAADLCLAAKVWERRTDVFSVAMRAEPIAAADAVPVFDERLPVSWPSESAAAAPDLPPVAAAAPTNQELHARLRIHPNIDEGTVADPDELDRAFARLVEHWIALDPVAKSWAAQLQEEAAQHNVGFHASKGHTLRRFELIRGLIALCAAGLDDSDLVRMLVEHVTGDDVAQWPAIAPGHALGSMDAAEAIRFAELVDALVVDAVQLTFSDAGRPRFVARVAA